jgi:thioredoxin-dependent peroxiredoxin
MKTLGTILASAFCVLGFAGANNVQAADLKPGDAAPAFEMKGSDGKTYKLSDFKGKQAVVIAWYPKAFTGG